MGLSVSTIALAMALASGGTFQDDRHHDPVGAATPAPATASPLILPILNPIVDAPHSDSPAQTAGDSSALPASPFGTAPTSAPDTGANDEIVVNASRRAIRADPLSGINAASFEAITFIDKAVVAPVAGTYEKVVPTPIRNGLRNVLINLAEPVVFLNFLLQFKPGKAFETVGRFAINSTIGVAGLFDMAKRKPFHLPYRQNGFANTFGYHGIKTGPFLFVPVLGPTTARDLVGRLLDLAVLPTVIGNPFNKPAYAIGTGVVKSMNDRVEFDEQITANREKSDPYVASRDFYLKRRQAEINALHSQDYRDRMGIVDTAPVQSTPPAAAVPSSMGMVPAAPLPAEPAPAPAQ